jgi:hypothetical protein
MEDGMQPVTDPLTVVFFSTGSAILGSLLTIFLTPRLQHHFWRRQRRSEIRLTAVNELARVISEFEIKFLFDQGYAPNQNQDRDFLKSFRKSTNDVRNLFSDSAFETFKELEKMVVGPTTDRTYEKFYEKERKAMRALYGELGLL